MLDDVSLDKLAACADKAAEKGPSSTTVAVVSESPSHPMQEIKKQVEELTKAAIGRSRGRSKSRNQWSKEIKKQEKIFIE